MSFIVRIDYVILRHLQDPFHAKPKLATNIYYNNVLQYCIFCLLSLNLMVRCWVWWYLVHWYPLSDENCRTSIQCFDLTMPISILRPLVKSIVEHDGLGCISAGRLNRYAFGGWMLFRSLVTSGMFFRVFDACFDHQSIYLHGYGYFHRNRQHIFQRNFIGMLDDSIP